MSTFLFEDLSQDAQERAIGLYWADDEVLECCNTHLDDGVPILAWDAFKFFLTDWRFNELGERIA